MCFNLSTLKKIALTKSQWMAPPHFRSPMDAQLKAQISYRFGRDQLSLPTQASMNMDRFDIENFLNSYAAWLHRRLNDLSDMYVFDAVCFVYTCLAIDRSISDLQVRLSCLLYVAAAAGLQLRVFQRPARSVF